MWLRVSSACFLETVIRHERFASELASEFLTAQSVSLPALSFSRLLHHIVGGEAQCELAEQSESRGQNTEHRTQNHKQIYSINFVRSLDYESVKHPRFAQKAGDQ